LLLAGSLNLWLKAKSFEEGLSLIIKCPGIGFQFIYPGGTSIPN
jgi:hypothetical protein